MVRQLVTSWSGGPCLSANQNPGQLVPWRQSQLNRQSPRQTAGVSGVRPVGWSRSRQEGGQLLVRVVQTLGGQATLGPSVSLHKGPEKCRHPVAPEGRRSL